MKSSYNVENESFTVVISKSELSNAFKSYEELEKFMHEMVAITYGEWTAEATFPLNRDEIHYKLKTK